MCDCKSSLVMDQRKLKKKIPVRNSLTVLIRSKIKVWHNDSPQKVYNYIC